MNFIILSILTTFALAELLNFLIRSYEEKRPALNKLFMDGGMPSRHASLVTALTLSVGIIEGYLSSLFLISLVFSLIVIRDAVGVRHNVDTVVGVLNKNVKKSQRIDVVSGHTKRQVMAGIFLALAVVSLLNYFL